MHRTTKCVISFLTIAMFLFSLILSEVQDDIKYRAITAAVVELIRPKKDLLSDSGAQLGSRALDI